MHKFLADLSRLLNRLRGGTPGKTLCWEEAMRRGWDCVFCRAIAAALRDRDHCLDELSAHEIAARKRAVAKTTSAARK